MFGHFTLLCMKGLNASLLGNILAGKGVTTQAKEQLEECRIFNSTSTFN